MRKTIRLGVLTLVALSALALVSTAVAHRVVVIKGTNNGETLTGTPGSDRIHARGGDDVVNAGEGNDRVFGCWGSDTLNGEGGNDRVRGGPGRDTVKRVALPHRAVTVTIPRDEIWLAQTPHGFRRSVLAEAVARGQRGLEATDEAMLAEQSGHTVTVTSPDPGVVSVTCGSGARTPAGAAEPPTSVTAANAKTRPIRPSIARIVGPGRAVLTSRTCVR